MKLVILFTQLLDTLKLETSFMMSTQNVVSGTVTEGEVQDTLK